MHYWYAQQLESISRELWWVKTANDKIYVLYNGFLLFTVIMLYNVVKNIGLANTESLFLGEKTRVVSCEPLITFLFNPYIILFYLCFCFQTSYLIYIIDSLALNSASRMITYAWMKLISHICFPTAFLCLRNG